MKAVGDANPLSASSQFTVGMPVKEISTRLGKMRPKNFTVGIGIMLAKRDMKRTG
jgi:hypothetical protein